jgi:hypothetical protein
VDEANKKRAHDVVQAEAAEVAVEPAERGVRRIVRMNFVIMSVRVGMNVIAVSVRVGMVDAGAAIVMISADAVMVLRVREIVCDPLQDASEIQDAEQNQHKSRRQFHREADTRGNDPAEQDEFSANEEDREGVADSSEGADSDGVLDGAIARDDGGSGDDVIDIGGVAYTKEETERDDGEQADHCLSTSRPAALKNGAAETLSTLFVRLFPS